MRLILFSILLLVALILLSKNLKPVYVHENFDSKQVNESLDDVIKYINNSIDERKNAGITSLLRNNKYQKQILPLQNALNYASYIQKNIL